MSHGLILYKVLRDAGDEVGDAPVQHREWGAQTYPRVKLLVVQRRHSMALTGLVAGHYRDAQQLRVYVAELTARERRLVRTASYARLWRMVFPDLRKVSTRREQLFLQHRSLMCAQIRETPEVYMLPEHGFPKGRPGRVETDLNCAVREVYEETGYTVANYKIHHDIEFVDHFKGTNNVYYQHHFWLARLSSVSRRLVAPVIPDRLEIRRADWYGFSELRSLFRLRSYETSKFSLLRRIQMTLTAMLVQHTPESVILGAAVRKTSAWSGAQTLNFRCRELASGSAYIIQVPLKNDLVQTIVYDEKKHKLWTPLPADLDCHLTPGRTFVAQTKSKTVQYKTALQLRLGACIALPCADAYLFDDTRPP